MIKDTEYYKQAYKRQVAISDRAFKRIDELVEENEDQFDKIQAGYWADAYIENAERDLAKAKAELEEEKRKHRITDHIVETRETTTLYYHDQMIKYMKKVQELEANSISKYDREAVVQAARGFGLHLIDSDQRAVFNDMLGFVGETSKRLGL